MAKNGNGMRLLVGVVATLLAAYLLGGIAVYARSERNAVGIRHNAETNREIKETLVRLENKVDRLLQK